MYIVQGYLTAVLFCIVTMITWGSSSNTQKLVSSKWRFELFCWDYVLGILLMASIFALTLGNYGNYGRSFFEDIQQGNINNISKAFLGGVIFNAANILLMAAVSIAGMSVAFSVGSGLALVIGVIVNYLDAPLGNSFMLFGGVTLIVIAIFLNALAYRRKSAGDGSLSSKGLLVSIGSGILMGLFFKYVANSMFPDFEVPMEGKLSPYTAVFIFATGVVASNLVFNTILMYKPITGAVIPFSDYFRGTFKDHLLGVFGGAIWCVGMTFSIIASDKAGTAISYGLASGAIVIASLWGIYYWKEFKGAPKGTSRLLNLMLICFFLGLIFIVLAR